MSAAAFSELIISHVQINVLCDITTYHTFLTILDEILDEILEDDWTLKDERKHHGAVEKSPNNRSVLWIESAFVMLKTGPIRLALAGLMAGRPSVHQAIRRRKSCCFRNFKIR